jgi:single-strand DNA-binding protein
MALNKIELMGRITSDLEMKVTNSGKEVVSFTLAVDRNYKGSDGNKITDFINCVAFGNQAKCIHSFFGKGRLLLVVGSLQSRQYTTQNNEKRTVFEVNVEEVHFTGEKKETQETPQNAPYVADAPVFEEMTTDDDLPF